MKKNKKKIALTILQEHDFVQAAWMDVNNVAPKAKIYMYESGLVEVWTPNGSIYIEQLLEKPHVIFDKIRCTMEIEN